MTKPQPPTVSIITPCYNAFRYLPATWKSVMCQSCDNWEWIVSDDGSTDGTVDWAKQIAKDFPDKVMILEGEHINKGAAENRALKIARGSIIMILDADDVWHRDKIKRQLDFLDQHPEADMTWSWVKEFWSGDSSMSGPTPNVWPRHGNPENFTKHILATGNTFCTSSLAIRKKVFDCIGGFNDRIPAHDDIEFLIRASYHFCIMRTPGVLVKYRITPNSLTGTPNPEKRIALRDAIVEQNLDRGPGGRAYHAIYHLQMAEFAMAGLLEDSPRPHLIRSLYYNPKAVSRWTFLPLLFLPQKLMFKAYVGMKKIQAGLFSKSTRSHRLSSQWAEKKK